MDPQAPGPTPAAEPSNGQQAPAQQPQTPPDGQQPPTSQQQEPQQSLEQLQQRLQQSEEARIRHENSARHFQSLADQNAARLRAMVGVVPQEDPLAKSAKFFESKGFDPEGGRAIAEYINQVVQPLQQRNQQLESTFQATQQTNGILEAAYQASPQLFQDPDVIREVQAGLNQVALAGQGNLMTAQYAEQLALLAWADRNAPGRQKAAPQQQPRLQIPQQFGWAGPTGGYQAMPVRQQGPQVDAAADAYVKQQMAGYGKPPTK